MTDVLVLNADTLPLHRVSLRHAIRMLFREVAVVHEAEPDRLIGVFPMPLVVRLVSYVTTKWRHAKGPSWSKRGVLARDNHQCSYCTRRGDTIDHIVPQSRGGRSTWSNTTAACSRCNQRKADRTPAEAGMVLRTTPVAPSWAALVAQR
jgi:5-methylcytosine-specific restriction endonuclease McrA